MQMRPRDAPRGTNQADHLSCLHRVSHRHQNPAQVHVRGHQPGAVVEVDGIALVIERARDHHDATVGRPDRRPRPAGEVHAQVPRAGRPVDLPARAKGLGHPPRHRYLEGAIPEPRRARRPGQRSANGPALLLQLFAERVRRRHEPWWQPQPLAREVSSPHRDAHQLIQRVPPTANHRQGDGNGRARAHRDGPQRPEPPILTALEAQRLTRQRSPHCPNRVSAGARPRVGTGDDDHRRPLARRVRRPTHRKRRPGRRPAPIDRAHRQCAGADQRRAQHRFPPRQRSGHCLLRYRPVAPRRLLYLPRP